MNRVARAVGGAIVHRTEELKESDVGTECGLYEVCSVLLFERVIAFHNHSLRLPLMILL